LAFFKPTEHALDAILVGVDVAAAGCRRVGLGWDDVLMAVLGEPAMLLE